MDYLFDLKEYLNGNDIPIPKTNAATRYEYQEKMYTSLKTVLEIIYNDILSDISPDQITIIKKFITDNNTNRGDDKTISLKIGETEHKYNLANSGTKTLFNHLKIDIQTLSELLKKDFLINDGILFKNLSEDNNNEETMKILKAKERSHMNVNELVRNAIENNKQVIFTGAPGTGKTYSVLEYVKENCEDETQYKFVQFHPSYDYSDFVEGLRPVVLQGQTEATFVRLDGVFKAFCRKIAEDTNKEKKYYFIVDEINRADLAKVFGELMFGLEESYRGKKFETQYKNLETHEIIDGRAVPIEKDVFEDGFYIPENLYFIGTMNDIDRSVDSMDFALRRRFQWVDIKANEIMNTSLLSILADKNISETDIDELADKIIAMNNVISTGNKFGLSEAYHIGPAYFKKLDLDHYDESLEKIFDTNITSILREYTRGRKADEVNDWIAKCRNALLGEQENG